MSFVHLHVHTEYSISDSIIRIESLVDTVSKYRMPAVGIADLNKMFGAVKLYKRCIEAGVKPLIGVEALIENPADEKSPFSLVLICQDNDGYRSMCQLLTRAHQESRKGEQPNLKKSWLAGCTDGLIALSGAQSGEIGQCLLQGNQFEDAQHALDVYRKLFPDRFYLEISRLGNGFDNDYGMRTLELADKTKTPVVATNQPRFINRDDFELHEIKICIYDHAVLSDEHRRRDCTEQQYLKSPEEMAEVFSDIPGAIANTHEIAARCNFTFDLDNVHLPAYPHAIKAPSIDEHLAETSMKGLSQKFTEEIPDEYLKRLNHELEIIRSTRFAGYFLIVADIIKWARDEGIPVGPGRGSGAGSLVAYALGITEIDPIEFDLIFERFLNPERVSPPDFDIDFCVDQRDKVIEHVAETYGKDRVAQIITYNTMAARAAVKDVGRALKPEYHYYDELAKLIPRDLDITLEKAKQRSADFNKRYEDEQRVTELVDTAESLEGIIRNSSKHPGGVVIAPTEITNFSALLVDNEGNKDVTHFDKNDLEAIGLVKFDFLGLTTLTVIDRTLNAIRSRRGDAEAVTVADMNFSDKKTYDLICTGNTIGIFQLESPGMQRLIQQMQPSSLNDLVALLALFRPGPLQTKMDQQFIANRRKPTEIQYLDPVLKPTLESTYGVILYQEQVMRIAQTMSGYTMGEADILRWAMGKKVASEMQKQRKRFVEGAASNGFEESLAESVYNQIQSFGEYGFNKSHSVAYAVLAFRTGWLKTHYPAEFLSACMSMELKSESIVKYVNEAKSMGLELERPDVNHSNFEFEAISDHEIRFGLGGIKKIGRPVAEAIMDARKKDKFTSVIDFCTRVEMTKLSKGALLALASAGALDELEPNRAKIYETADELYSYSRQKNTDRRHGQSSLFGEELETETFEMQDVREWTTSERLNKELEVLGLFLSGHPIERYASEIEGIADKVVKDISSDGNVAVLTGGWVQKMEVKQTKNSDQWASIELQDRSGVITVDIFKNTFNSCKDKIKEHTPLYVVGKGQTDKIDSKLRFIADQVYTIDAVRDMPNVTLNLNIDSNSVDLATHERRLKDIFSAHHGKQAVRVNYTSQAGTAQVTLGENWKVKICDSLMDEISVLVGAANVSIDYSDANTRDLKLSMRPQPNRNNYRSN